MNDSVTALIQSGLCYHQQGNFAAAEATYEKALSLEPHNPDALHLAGVVSHQRGDHHQAIDRIQRAINVAPRAQYHNSLGEALRALQKNEPAIAAYHIAIKLDPHYAAAHHNLGVTLSARGEYHDARASLMHALELEPTDADTLNQLGEVAQTCAELSQALAYFRAAINANPQHRQARANLANLLTDNNQPFKALELTRNAMSVRPASAALIHAYGRALLATDDLEGARKAIHWSLVLMPCFVDAYVTLGLCREQMADAAGAQSAFEIACVIDPSHALAKSRVQR